MINLKHQHPGPKQAEMEINAYGRLIGGDYPCYIIAEIGINHNGSVQMALEMMAQAKEAGADAVKFQKRHIETEVPKAEWSKRKYGTPWGNLNYKQYKEKIELTASAYERIAEKAEELHLDWGVSVWGYESLEQMVAGDYPYPAFIKVPSAKLTDHKLIEFLANVYKSYPAILSTGMSRDAEVGHALAEFKRPVGLLQCTSAYPAPLDTLDLAVIQNYRIRWGSSEAVVGYSGHETGLATTVAAVALGAKIVERHFTLDRAMWGTDQSASVEPQGFARLVKDIRNVEQAIGSYEKRVHDIELPQRKKLRGE